MEKELFEACKSGNIDKVMALIAADAQVNIADADNNTPLHYAAQTGNADLVTHLLASGADPNAQNSEGQTPILLSVLIEEAEYETLKALIKGGGDVNIPQHNGYSPMHLAADKGLLEQVKLMISSGADVHKTAGTRQETPLHEESFQNNHEIVEELILAGADPDQLNQEGKSPLAILMDNVFDHKTQETLIRFGASLTNIPVESINFLINIPQIESAAAVHFINKHFLSTNKLDFIRAIGTGEAKQELQQTIRLVKPRFGVYPITKKYEGESGLLFSTRFSLPLAQKTFITTTNACLAAGMEGGLSSTQATYAALQTYFALENFQKPIQSCFYQSRHILPPETAKTVMLVAKRIAINPDTQLPAIPDIIWTKIITDLMLSQTSTLTEDSGLLQDSIVKTQFGD